MLNQVAKANSKISAAKTKSFKICQTFQRDLKILQQKNSSGCKGGGGTAILWQAAHAPMLVNTFY